MGENREKFVFAIPRNKNYDIDLLYKTIEADLNK